MIGFFFQPAVASKQKQENKKKGLQKVQNEVGFMEMTYLMTYNYVHVIHFLLKLSFKQNTDCQRQQSSE